MQRWQIASLMMLLLVFVLGLLSTMSLLRINQDIRRSAAWDGTTAPTITNQSLIEPENILSNGNKVATPVVLTLQLLDTNQDQKADKSDYLLIKQNYWRGQSGAAAADMDGNGWVDIADYALFSQGIN